MSFYAEIGGQYSKEACPKLLDGCAMAAIYLRTGFIKKSRGGFDIYRDQKISIEIDANLPEIRVDIRRGDHWETVFVYSYHGFVRLYRPGKWEMYVINILLPLAEKKKQKAERNWEEQRTQNPRNFSEVIDLSTFGDLSDCEEIPLPSQEKFSPADDSAIFVEVGDD